MQRNRCCRHLEEAVVELQVSVDLYPYWRLVIGNWPVSVNFKSAVENAKGTVFFFWRKNAKGTWSFYSFYFRVMHNKEYIYIYIYIGRENVQATSTWTHDMSENQLIQGFCVIMIISYSYACTRHTCVYGIRI